MINKNLLPLKLKSFIFWLQPKNINVDDRRNDSKIYSARNPLWTGFVKEVSVYRIEKDKKLNYGITFRGSEQPETCRKCTKTSCAECKIAQTFDANDIGQKNTETTYNLLSEQYRKAQNTTTEITPEKYKELLKERQKDNIEPYICGQFYGKPRS
ncbi:MAG: hypothetical protein LBL75_02265 [Rickettsiales bacterium]|jgi:hypothetical protein|nr:hypothetical protein [Rickettsiales bacterium]